MHISLINKKETTGSAYPSLGCPTTTFGTKDVYTIYLMLTSETWEPHMSRLKNMVH